MQQHHYTAPELTGDDNFPSHLERREARNLIANHDHRVEVESDGTLKVTYICSKGDRAFDAIKRFSPTQDGMFRAAPILLWLGY